MPVIKILPHPEYCPSGTELTAPAGFAEAVRAKRDEAKQLYGR